MSRLMSFYHSLSKSQTVCTHPCYQVCKTSQTNRKLLLSKLNEGEHDECSMMHKQYLRSVYGNKEKCVANGALLKEMCLLRDGRLTTDQNSSDIFHLIDFICTS